jgi:hypothetical protein
MPLSTRPLRTIFRKAAGVSFLIGSVRFGASVDPTASTPWHR